MMKLRKIRAISILVWGILTVLVLGGCGGGSGDDVMETEKPDAKDVMKEAKELDTQCINAVYTPDRLVGSVEKDMFTPSRWVDEEQIGRLLMTEEEICSYNENVMEAGTGVVDLFAIEDETDGDTVAALIEKYQLNENYYLNGSPITWEEMEILKKKRNLDALAGEDALTVGYGLVAVPADLRSFPSADLYNKKPEEPESDYFQESLLAVGEGVRIYHYTEDREWAFVQAKNYAGWVRAENLCLCTRDVMRQYTENPQFLVTLSPQRVEADGRELSLPMGIRLPYTESDGAICALIPEPSDVVQEDHKFLSVPLKDGAWHIGYLPFTRTQLINQAMKLLNISYGWGCKGEDTLDCSATMLSVYGCFGFSLPRNTSDMKKIPENNTDLSGYGPEDKTEVLSGCQPGSLLLMKGHVMMLLGVEDGQVYALHDFKRYFSDEGEKIPVEQCTVTPLDIQQNSRGTYSYLDGVNCCVEIR